MALQNSKRVDMTGFLLKIKKTYPIKVCSVLLNLLVLFQLATHVAAVLSRVSRFHAIQDLRYFMLGRIRFS
jgi:hypothetical protein